MKDTARNRADLALNLLIVLSTLWAVGIYFVGGEDAAGISGRFSLCFFTTDSNILVGVASLLMLPCCFAKLRDPDREFSRPLMIFKYAAAVSVTITLLTVVFFLGPVGWLTSGSFRGYLKFFAGNTFVLHFSTPVLAILSLLLETRPALSFRASLWSLAPTVVYSVVYIIQVLILKNWYDWYGFTFGGRLAMAPVSLLAMYLLTFCVDLILRRLRGERAA